MKNELIFSGEPEEVDPYLKLQFELSARLEAIDKYINQIYKIYGDKGPKIGFGGEVDFDRILLDIENEKAQIETAIQINRRKRLGLVAIDA
jgi:hypothetical protein